MKKNLKIGVKGEYSYKMRKGASAYVIVDDKTDELGFTIDQESRMNVFTLDQSDNSFRAELKAINAALEEVKSYTGPVEFYTNNNAVIGALKKPWDAGGNSDLLSEYILLTRNKTVSFSRYPEEMQKYQDMCKKACSLVAGYDFTHEYSKYQSK